jgi:hypothetical protein
VGAERIGNRFQNDSHASQGEYGWRYRDKLQVCCTGVSGHVTASLLIGCPPLTMRARSIFRLPAGPSWSSALKNLATCRVLCPFCARVLTCRTNLTNLRAYARLPAPCELT